MLPFSNKVQFWLMLIVTVIMGYITMRDIACGSWLWAVVMGIFTYFNLISTLRLYRMIGGVGGAINLGSTHNAFHEQKTFKDLDMD